MPLNFDRRGAVGLLTLDNPQRGNALAPADMLALGELLDEIAGDVRALVIRGAGDRVFCAGYDLARLSDVRDGDGGRWADRFPELVFAVDAYRRFPWPIVACLNGHAIGGGALLASLSDLRVARPGVRFQIPASRIGVMYPLEGLRRLVSLVGVGRCAELLLGGGAVDAERGLAWGLYNEVVDDPETRALAWAEELCERAPLTIQGIRALLLSLDEGRGEEAVLALHAHWTARCVTSSDLAEGIAATREGRAPRFEGR